MSGATRTPEEAARLRAEHDALAAELEVRRSIDVGRRGLYLLFAGLIGAGTSVALGWDRWGTLKPGVVRKVHAGPPVFLYLAAAITVVLLALALRDLVRARGLMRAEDARWARYRALREALGLEP